MTDAELKRKVRQAKALFARADKITEQAAMASFELYRMLKFGRGPNPQTPLPPRGQRVLDCLDQAHAQSGDARYALGDAHYQLEQVERTLR